METWLSSPHGAQLEPPSKHWSRSRAIAGQLRTASRLPRMSWVLISQRNPFVARLASPRLTGHAGLRHDGGDQVSRERCATPKRTSLDQKTKDTPPSPPLIRWSVQEIRRIAVRIAQRRIQPEHIIAWSLWRRAHQAVARQAQIRHKMQL